MHCNLRPPDVAPVILGSNTRPNPIMHWPTSSTIFKNLCGTAVHQRFTFQHNRAIHGWDIEVLAIFFWKGYFDSRREFNGNVLEKFVLHMRRNCYFPASGQNPGVTIRISDPLADKYFFTDYTTFSGVFHCKHRLSAIFLFPVYVTWWPWTCLAPHWDDFSSSLKSANLSVADLTTRTLRHAVTLTFDRLTLNVCRISAVM